MIGEVVVRLLVAWALCAAIQAVLWMVAQKTKNAGIVDVGWALSFSAVVAMFALGRVAAPGGWLPIAVIAIAWSGRLGLYLIARGAATGPEEGRYVELRAKWQPGEARAFFIFFQVQAALTAVLSTAFVVPFLEPPSDGGWLRVLGSLVAVTAIAGESIADAQLARWKADPNHRGMVCDVGLWSYSRHPNYFFEWLVWVGFAVYGFGFAHGWVAVAAQALILGSIWKVTGIPATEAQALRSKGEAYRAYQQRTSAFFPRPRRR